MPVRAQPYSVTWHAICSGGVTSPTVGGAYGLAGTIGQPDANVGSTGGVYALTGGFWTVTTTSCYANCDGVGGLTANDFQCFLNKYVSNDLYANCDGVGGLTANDFQCFLNAYVAGCS